MLEAIATMSALGLGLGVSLGIAARCFRVEAEPIVAKLAALMPGTNCGQCGLAGCQVAAEAIAKGEAPVTLCPPGGRTLAKELASHLGVSVEAGSGADPAELVAFVFEDLCVGCTKCFKRCPTDAIVGASRQIHTVIEDACIGCRACVDICPTEAIVSRARPDTLKTWRWSKPPERSRHPGLVAVTAP